VKTILFVIIRRLDAVYTSGTKVRMANRRGSAHVCDIMASSIAIPVATSRSIHSMRESPAGNIPAQSYRPDHDPPNVCTVPMDSRKTPWIKDVFQLRLSCRPAAAISLASSGRRIPADMPVKVLYAGMAWVGRGRFRTTPTLASLADELANGKRSCPIDDGSAF
jgi:hypothetical protein